MSKIPAINEIDANSPSQESTEVVVKATTVTPDINEIQETISSSATIQEIDGTRKPTISEIYKIVNDGLFESTTNWWDYAYKISQAQLNQDIISRLDNGVIGGGYSKGVDIITTTSNKVPSNTNVYSALKSDSLYPKKLNDEVINGIYDFLNGLTIGKPTAYTGGTWSVDQIGKTHLTTDYLYVRLKAIFETLQILNVETIGGKLVISPAGSIRVAYVDRIKIDAPVFKHDEKTDVWSISQVEDEEGNLVNETLNQEVYRCYFLGEQDGEEVENKWKVGDQAQAKTFNVKKGTYHKVENSYLWRLVVNVSSDTIDIDGKKYHYVDLSQIDFDSSSDAPAPGDVLNQLGHRLNDAQRQTALVLNAVDNYAPSITLYAGVNYYTLLNKEYVEFGVYNGKAFFNVYGDMYIGDKGENPRTYIKYKNGKINIKANLEIGSSIGDKDLDQYIKENGGVDEETVKNLINNAQVIKDLQNQADGAIETWFYEGVPTLDNLPAVDWTTNEIKKVHIGDLYYDQTTGYAYRFTKYNDDVNPYRWNRIKDNDIVAALEAANHAQATADGKMKVFYGETKPTNYQVGDMWVNATLEGKFNNDIARAVAKSESFNADDWVLASRYSEAIATIQKWTNEYETKFSNLVDEVKQQKDQSIIVWYLEYEPTVDNAPANTWNTETLRSEHIGDIVYDIKNNHSYRWTGSAWVQIKDADFNEAMKAAKAADDKAGAAGDLADSKRRIFYSDTTPTKPFDKGDLWIKQVDDKTETWVYNGTNWVKSEDKDLADFSAAINEELAGIKGQLDGKAETWYQVDDPSTDWTDKASHEGDIWYNTTYGTTNYWNGSAWEQMDIPKDVFDTIDGKSSIFVDSYADAKAGTGVICKGYKERDLWILPADATVNGVEYYKGDMLTAVSNNTNFDETNWKKKVRYVGQTELTSAIDIVNEKINTINNTTIPGINNKFNEFVKDGVLDSSEKARLTDLLNQANNEVAAVIDQVNNITTSKYLTNDNANKGKLEEANTVMNTAWTEYKNLINTLIDTNTEITKVNIGEANTKYKNLQEKIKAVKQYLAICQADVLSGMGTDITSYKYLKEAFKGKTEVNGGLVVTNVLQLRQTSDASSPVTAGISGLQGKANADGIVDKDTYDITSIAAWFGGPMVDKDIFTDEQLNNKVAGTDYARSLFRHDGSGYLASGAIYWGTDGVLHGDPNSFILQGTSITTIFYYVRLFYLHYGNQDSTDFNKITYVTPMKTFSRLSVLPLGGIEEGHNLPTGLFIGDSNTGGSFQIGNIILRTKSGDPNILEIVSASSNKTAHLGVQGGISAYGTYNPSTGGGSGLNGTIIPYATAITSDPQNEGSKIASASSIYKLHSRISAIENNGATSITVTGTGNAITSVSKNGTSITFTKGTTFLTSHQSLADYAKKSEIPTTLPANGGNADTVDGYHANALLTYLSNSNYGISITVGGTTKSVSDINVNGANTILGISPQIAAATESNSIYVLSPGYDTDKPVKKLCFDWYGNYWALSNIRSGDTSSAGFGVFFKNTEIARFTSDGNLSCNAASASKLTSSAGSATLPIYFSDGKPVACTMSTGRGDGITLSFGRGAYTSANQYFGNGTIVAIDPKGEGCISANDTIFSLGDSSDRNTQLLVGWDRDGVYYRRITDRLDYYGNWKRLAFTTDNVASATKLQTSRLLWGQSFDGTGNVSGSLSGVGHIQFSADVTYSIGTPTTEAAHTYTRQIWARHLNASRVYTGDTNLYIGFTNTAQVKFYSGTNLSGDGSNERMTILTNGNIGIGTASPIEKLDVNGNIISNNIRIYGNEVTNDSKGLFIQASNKTNRGFITYNGNTSDGYLNICSTFSHIVLSPYGNVGIGTTTPAHKLHVEGNIYSSATIRTAAQNQAIILSNDASPAWISALEGQIIFNTGKPIRFGGTDWDWTQWAGLKYTHSNKTIYLGIADGSVFTTNTAQTDGTLRLAGIKTVTPDSGARIGGSGGDLYLGNASNSAWVKVQNMCSQTTTDNWRIYQTGAAVFNSLTINKVTTISGDLIVNGLINNKGILPASYEVNNKGTSCYVSADALCSGITAITDSIPISNVDIHYSNDNGNSWTKYPMNNDVKFNIYASNAGLNQVYLGYNVIPPDIDPDVLNQIKDEDEKLAQIKKNEAEKLAQIKKNQLMFTFNVPNSCYSQLCFASVDISNGIDTICTVEILNNNGAVVDTYTKHMAGWNQINYISLLYNGNAGYALGNDSRRYIRFKFKHDQKTTALRNTIIHKIRIFSFTKYSFPTDRFMGHTGHIYNFDYNMNTYFPNSILAKGGVTAYQSSDIRLKTNITKLNCLNVIKSIGGTYEFDYIRDHKHSIGFIAQNVNNPLLNDIIAKDDNGYLKINYWNPKLISLAFGALTEIDDEVDKLKARVRELESEVEYLKNKDYVLQ